MNKTVIIQRDENNTPQIIPTDEEKVKVFETFEKAKENEELENGEIFGTPETDLAGVAVTDTIEKDNLNPVTSNAVALALEEGKETRPLYVLNNEGINELQEGTDLNDITEAGVYRASGAIIASSLVNCPVESGFKMIVNRLNNNVIIQDIIGVFTNDSKKFTRSHNTGWGSWKQYGGYDETLFARHNQINQSALLTRDTNNALLIDVENEDATVMRLEVGDNHIKKRKRENGIWSDVAVYYPRTVQKIKLIENTIPGCTVSSRDNRGSYAYVYNDICVLNVNISVSGTYTGTTNWVNLFTNVPSGFEAPYTLYPYNPVESGVLNGCLQYLRNGVNYNFTYWYQVILTKAV